MFKKLISIIIILLINSNSYAADSWDKEEIALASLFTVATIIDWGQTRDIVYHQTHSCQKKYKVIDKNNHIHYFYDKNFISNDYKLIHSKTECFKLPKGYEKFSKYHETNFILGKSPTIDKVDKYMPLAIGGVLITSHFLPKKYRKTFLGIMSMLELYAISNNQSRGLKINFKF